VIQSLALTTVNDSLRNSIESVIRSLVAQSSSPRDSTRKSVVVGDSESSRLKDVDGDAGADEDGLSASRRSIVTSIRSTLSVDDTMLDAVRHQAAELAEAITRQILAQAVVVQTTHTTDHASEPSLSSTDPAPHPSDVAAWAAVIARTITPTILAEAVHSSCSAALQGHTSSPPTSGRSTGGGGGGGAEAMSLALVESISPQVLAESLSAAACSARREEGEFVPLSEVSEEGLYEDIFHSSSRGLRELGADGRQCDAGEL
jgi:hypothetical protein